MVQNDKIEIQDGGHAYEKKKKMTHVASVSEVWLMCQGDSLSSEIQVDKHRLVAKVVQLQTLNASLTNKV